MYSAIAQRVPIVIAKRRKLRFGSNPVISTFCLMFLFGPTYAANSLGFLQRAQTIAVVQAVQQAAEVRSLEVGPLILRELKGGQSHTYEISIAAGQYANVVVDQKGIDVVVKLLRTGRKVNHGGR
jgi:transcriptional regulator of nitric oxide reductase